MRVDLIPVHVLAGRTVLDVASNIGMSSILAHARGASACRGLEVSSRMVDISTRFAMFEGAFPKVRYTTFNLDRDCLINECYDTAFMFSIYAHLKKPQNLLEIARHNVKRFVVFEGHPGTSRVDYIPFLESGVFGRISELGLLPCSRLVDLPRNKRPLWLCEK
jgi:hypothetical protein